MDMSDDDCKICNFYFWQTEKKEEMTLTLSSISLDLDLIVGGKVSRRLPSILSNQKARATAAALSAAGLLEPDSGPVGLHPAQTGSTTPGLLPTAARQVLPYTEQHQYWVPQMKCI